MAQEKDIYLNDLVIKSARILIALLTPGFVFSITRAILEDGAVGVIALQSVVYLVMVACCIERFGLRPKTRVVAIACMSLLIGVGGIFRNQEAYIGLSYAWLAGIYLSLILVGVARYLVPVVLLAVVSAVAYSAGYTSLIAGLSHLFAFAGIALASIYLLDRVRERVESEKERADESADARVNEALQRELIAETAGIAFMEFDYEVGQIKGDAVLNQRFGLAEDHPSINLADYSDRFSPDEFELIANIIAESATQPLGWRTDFTHRQKMASGEWRDFRAVGKTVERHGKMLWLGASTDITAEVSTERRAKDFQDRIDLVSSSGGIGLIEFFPDTRTFIGNAEIARRIGLEPSHEERSIDLFYAHQTDEVKSHFIPPREQLKTSALISFTHPFYLPSGELRHFRVSRAVRNLDGRASVLGFSVDVTEEVRAVEEVKKHSELLDIVAQSGGIAYFEVNFSQMTIQGSDLLYERDGLSPDTGAYSLTQILANVPEAAREKMQADIGAAMNRPEGEMYTFTHPYICHDGRAIEVRVTATNRLREGELWAFGASVDITEEIATQKRIAEQLTQINSQQEQKAQMYAVIGHELRTPAASIRMLVETAQEEQQAVDSDLLLNSIDQLLGVIDTLRMVAQPEKLAESEHVAVLVSELINNQVNMLQPLAKQQGYHLRADTSGLSPHTIRTQPQLLKQLISNLVKNALLHSQGSEVNVNAESAINGSIKILHISVEDNGVGIPEGKVAELFEPYQRGDSKAEGTGLGLYVCREIARSLDGDLRVENRAEGGACFTLSFSAPVVEAASAEESGSPISNPFDGLNVLIAEDNLTIRMLTQKMLNARGATVTAVENGEDALALCKEHTYHLILSDIFMPKLDGYGFVKGVRELGITTPIVGLTAATLGDETDRMLESGANLVTSKPIDIRKLSNYLIGQAEASA